MNCICKHTSSASNFYINGMPMLSQVYKYIKLTIKFYYSLSCTSVDHE